MLWDPYPDYNCKSGSKRQKNADPDPQQLYSYSIEYLISYGSVYLVFLHLRFTKLD